MLKLLWLLTLLPALSWGSSQKCHYKTTQENYLSLISVIKNQSNALSEVFAGKSIATFAVQDLFRARV